MALALPRLWRTSAIQLRLDVPGWSLDTSRIDETRYALLD
jgi:hypothetical protein